MAAALIQAELAKKRCTSLINQTLDSLPPSKVSPSSKLTLHRLLSAEMRFLSSQSQRQRSFNSLNLGYLESILRTIQHPSIHQVSRLCKPIPSSSLHVDIVCTFARSPAWFFVSDRNPSCVSWSHSRKSFSIRLHRILAAARSAVVLKPAVVVLVFARGVASDVDRGLVGEFGAVKIDLLGGGSRAFEIYVGVESGGNARALRGLGVGDGKGFGGRSDSDDNEFRSLVSSMRSDGDDLVHFDTTTLVALVSGISNAGRERLLMTSESEMWFRFRNKYKFVVTEVLCELEHPLLSELKDVIGGKRGIISASVCSEFKELVSLCGGPDEKLRANHLIKHLSVVPDNPSHRVSGLPTTRRIRSKNKIAFGTGDYWRAPTLTANMGFVRAISQIGMSLLTIQHRPRALIGD